MRITSCRGRGARMEVEAAEGRGWGRGRAERFNEAELKGGGLWTRSLRPCASPTPLFTLSLRTAASSGLGEGS